MRLYIQMSKNDFFFLSFRFSSEEVSAQNQVKASVQRRIRQSIADEVMSLFFFVLVFVVLRYH